MEFIYYILIASVNCYIWIYDSEFEFSKQQMNQGKVVVV